MKYSITIITCIAVAFACFFVLNKSDYKQDFAEKYSLSVLEKSSRVNETKGTLDWILDQRLDDYKKNIGHLNKSLLNITVLVVLGLLLLFYKPDGIDVSFLSIKIPEPLFPLWHFVLK